MYSHIVLSQEQSNPSEVVLGGLRALGRRVLSPEGLISNNRRAYRCHPSKVDPATMLRKTI